MRCRFHRESSEAAKGGVIGAVQRRGRFGQAFLACVAAAALAFCLTACSSGQDNSDAGAQSGNDAAASNGAESNAGFTVKAGRASASSLDDMQKAALNLLNAKLESMKPDLVAAGVDVDATEIGFDIIDFSNSPDYDEVDFAVKFWNTDGKRVHLYEDADGTIKASTKLINLKVKGASGADVVRGDANENSCANLAEVFFEKDRTDLSNGKLTLEIHTLAPDGNVYGATTARYYAAVPDSLAGVEPAVGQALKESLSAEGYFSGVSGSIFDAVGADAGKSSATIRSLNFSTDNDSEGEYCASVVVNYEDSSGESIENVAGSNLFNVWMKIVDNGTVLVDKVERS